MGTSVNRRTGGHVRVGGAGEPLEVAVGHTGADLVEQGVVQRVVRVDSPQALYLNSHEIEDFGSVQTQISLRIFQMSASVGRGFACEAIVSVA